jgi:hypothetical protein
MLGQQLKRRLVDEPLDHAARRQDRSIRRQPIAVLGKGQDAEVGARHQYRRFRKGPGEPFEHVDEILAGSRHDQAVACAGAARRVVRRACDADHGDVAARQQPRRLQSGDRVQADHDRRR